MDPINAALLTNSNSTQRKLSNESLQGPSSNRKRLKFIAIVLLFIIVASSNTFMSKTVYQLLSSNNVSTNNDYWVSYLLMLGQFVIGIPMLLFCNFRQMFAKFSFNYLIRFMIISIFDILVNGGDYIGLIFLPAAIVSILSTTLQIIFLTLIRGLRKRKITKFNYIGIIFVLIGTIIVSVGNIISADSSTITDTIIGICIMVFVGLSGATRCTIEEILLKQKNIPVNNNNNNIHRNNNDVIDSSSSGINIGIDTNTNTDSDGIDSERNIHVFNTAFIYGIESLISTIFTLILGTILMLCHFLDSNFDKIVPIFKKDLFNADNSASLIICILVFLVGMFLQNYLKMHVTKLSSAVTRKIMQSIQSCLVWIMSLVMYYLIANSKLGEKWQSEYSWLRLLGFIVVFLGIYVFAKNFTRG